MECTVSDLWNIEPLIQYSFTLIRQPTFVLYKTGCDFFIHGYCCVMDFCYTIHLQIPF